MKKCLVSALVFSIFLSACGNGEVQTSSVNLQELTNKEEAEMQIPDDEIVTSLDQLTFPIGQKVDSDSFIGTAYIAPMISNDDVYNFPATNNVTFEPSARSSWHTHGGMIILVTGLHGILSGRRKTGTDYQKG